VSGGNVGELLIESSLITLFGLSEDIQELVPTLPVSPPGVALLPDDNVNIRITETEIGEANGTSILILPLGGHADIVIEEVAVRDQGHVDGASISPGIGVLSLGNSSVDLTVQDTSVSNIGAGNSNSDGMVFLAIESSAMEVLVDEYRYVNPDGDGGGSATGLEIGNLIGTEAWFEGEVKNSRIDSPTSAGMQIVDQQGAGNNYLNVHVHDNEIFDADSGIFFGAIGFGASDNTDVVTSGSSVIRS
jgi:hypothetical protein